MKNFLIVMSTASVIIAHSLAAERPSQLVIQKDYAKTPSVAINGKTVTGNKVLPELIVLIQRQGHDAPIVVILPDSLRFVDWSNVKGLIGMVGFTSVRYFVRSNSTGKMIELQQVGLAIDKVPDQ